MKAMLILSAPLLVLTGVAVSAGCGPVGEGSSRRSDPSGDVAHSASTSSAVGGGPVRGVANDTWADVVIGKPDFTQIQQYRTVQNELFIPEGVWIDRSRHSYGTQKAYAYDSGNNRILGYNWDACIAGTTSPLNCSPSIVLGQPNFTSAGCNGDSGFQNYPTRPVASATTLCGLREDQVSITEGGSGASMVTDSSGALYVTDFWNNRVLKYTDPFATDTVADAVWGQSDFRGNLCNKSSVQGAPPDATTLCFTWGNNNSWTAGVDLDSAGNLWVGDSGNHRVLRFPKGSTTADIVIGQTSFTATNGTTFQDPVALRFSPKTGNLYVADNGSGMQKVLRFSPPFATGMSGTTFATLEGPMGIDVDPAGRGLWITQRGAATIDLFDESGTRLRSVAAASGDSGLSGSVGIDLAGNMASASRYGQFGHNITVYKTNGALTSVAAVNGNAVDNGSLGQLMGIEVAGNQLIAADGARLLAWNSPGTLTSGGSASIVNPTSCCINSLKADNSNHLWTVYGNGAWDWSAFKLVAYSLPLGSSLTPIQTIDLANTLPLVAGGTIDLSKDKVLSITPDGGDAVWITGGAATSRVVRIRHALTSPVVDVVLGQADASSTLCNRDHLLGFDDTSDIVNAKPNTLCAPGSVSVDRHGNVWVADQSIEINGNLRLLEFDASAFAGNPATPIYGPPATRIYGTSANFEAGFDSNGRLVAGFNPYADDSAYYGQGRFSALYWWPLTETPPSSSTPPQPDLYLSDFESYPYSAAFDSSGNFYAADIDRSRILVYHGLPQPACKTVQNNAFQSMSFPAQTGTFTAQFDATPSLSPTNGTVGFAGYAPTLNTDFSAMIRYNPNGFIDARNGTVFQAATSIPYHANVKYHFRFVINIQTQRYSAYVSTGGGAEQAVGLNYAFRHSATSLSYLGGWVASTPGGTDTVCGTGVSFSGP